MVVGAFFVHIYYDSSLPDGMKNNKKNRSYYLYSV